MSEIYQKDNSMISTHFSKNYSAFQTDYLDTKVRKSILLSYAKQPMAKQLPRWTQSASTWRHSSQRYSFSKDTRFENCKLNYADILKPTLPSTNNRKSCTFGKGTKKPISEVILRNAKQKLSPDSYNFTQFNQQPRSDTFGKGKTFGVGWKHYQRVNIPHRKDVYSAHFTKDIPPAKYWIRQVPGKHKRAFSTYAMLKMYTQQMADVTRGNPGAYHKVKDRHLQNTAGLQYRSFGHGSRIDLAAPANNFPGAVYSIPGFAQKFTKTKRKVNRKRKI